LDERLGKVTVLKGLTHVPIEVDGGINDQTILKAKGAGADRFVSTSFVTQSDDPQDHFNLLTKLVG
jgi:ribulose-phosphate 3-epimerase